MDFDDMIRTITPEIYENLKTAVETGRWPDGNRLTKDQLEMSMQAIIAYDHQHHGEAERVGYIDRGTKEEGEVCDSDQPDGEKPVRFLNS
jgi:uncharacterized protein YeaC (DUF1315 family)